MLKQIDPKSLARQGYIKFDVETGLSADGRSICLVSDEEKNILKTLRHTFHGKYPQGLFFGVKDVLGRKA